MSADFFQKRIARFAVGVLAVIFIAVCTLYAGFLSQTKRVKISTCFYYLVSEDTHLEAGAEFIKWQGGAGYLLRFQEREYVVLSVYLTEEDGYAVQTSLLQKGKSVRVLRLGREMLYFKTAKEKKNAGIYVGALQTMYGCAQVLSDCISRLEKGMTQEGCKRVLSPLERQFFFLSERYKEEYPSFSHFCEKTAEELFLTQQNIIYVKDLRYLLCEICVGWEDLASEFSF